MLVTSIFLLFPQCFLLYQGKLASFERELILSSAIALDLEKVKISTSSKGLELFTLPFRTHSVLFEFASELLAIEWKYLAADWTGNTY